MAESHDVFDRLDGIANCVTGLSDPELDVRQNTVRTPSHQQTTWHWEQEWLQSWMAWREVSQPPRDMFREGLDLIEVEPPEFDLGDTDEWIDGSVKADASGLLTRTKGLLWWAHRLFEQGDKVGGAVLIPLIVDGMDPALPLDVRRITRIDGWSVLDRSEITPWVAAGSPNTEPTHYVMSDWLNGTHQAELKPGDVIHASRLIVNLGPRNLSTRERRRRNWWGASALELNVRERAGAEQGMEYARTYMHRASWLHMQIAQLQEIYNAKDEDGNLIGQDRIDRRMRQMRRIISTLGMAITDGGTAGTVDPQSMAQIPGRSPDKLESIGESAGDLPELIQRNWDAWQYGIDQPRSLAFGESVGGLNSGENAGDWQSWQGNIRSLQRNRANDVIQWMLGLIWWARQGPTHGAVPESFRIHWRPLVVPSDKERAETAKLRAEADNARIEKGVARVDEVRQQRILEGDVDGKLREGKVEEEEVITGLPPAQVGIAQALLSAGQAVGEGTISPAFAAFFASAIDEERFGPERLSELVRVLEAMPRAAAVPTGSMPTAAVEAVEAVVAEGPPLPTEDAADPLPEPEPEPDEVEIAWAQAEPPPDADTSTALAQHPALATRISAQGITQLGKLGEIPIYPDIRRGKPRPVYSLREVKEALLRRAGLIAQPDVEDESEQESLDG